MEELIEFIASRTGLNESEVRQVLLELRDAAVFFTLQDVAPGRHGDQEPPAPFGAR
jgi:hypothetical protein